VKTIIRIDSAEVILEFDFPYVQMAICVGDQMQSCLTLDIKEAEMLRASLQAMVDVLQTQDILE